MDQPDQGTLEIIIWFAGVLNGVLIGWTAGRLHELKKARKP
jgi:hypothetical protein